MMKLYYNLKPLIPRFIQLALRRTLVNYQQKKYENHWPIDYSAANAPAEWQGWPNQKQFALVLTHDVESAEGLKKCYNVVELEKAFGFRSSFYFVAERYKNSLDLHHYLIKNGFEVGVHGLLHDGKLFSSRKVFQQRAAQINHYLKEWNAVGFRSPAMHHNLEWIHELKIEYDTSTFDTDPFEPQSDSLGTIFPCYMPGNFHRRDYIEIPYTLPQDFLLFILMKNKNIDIWKHKVDYVAENGGMVLLNTHPDYMNFHNRKCTSEEYPAEYYQKFLDYIKTNYSGLYWHALPRQVSRFWLKMYSKKFAPMPTTINESNPLTHCMAKKI